MRKQLLSTLILSAITLALLPQAQAAVSLKATQDDDAVTFINMLQDSQNKTNYILCFDKTWGSASFHNLPAAVAYNQTFSMYPASSGYKYFGAGYKIMRYTGSDTPTAVCKSKNEGTYVGYSSVTVSLAQHDLKFYTLACNDDVNCEEEENSDNYDVVFQAPPAPAAAK